MFSRGQGTVEYLVIISVVIVLSLIVVGLVITQVDNSSDVSGTSSEIGTKIGVGGISLGSSVAGVDGNGLLVIKNLNSENLTLSKIIIDGVDHNFGEQLVSGGEKSFKLQDIAVCDGEKKNYSVKVEYVSASGLTKVADFGNVSLDCASVVTPAGVAVEEVFSNVAPSVELSSPADDYSTTETRVSFVFTPSDSDGPVSSCSLNLSDLMDANSSSNISEGVENTLEYTLSVGSYDWNISCTDDSGDTNTSIIQSLTIKLIGGNNLVAHYFMNDNESSTVVLDNVASNNGVASTNTIDMNVSGKVNSALYFDGTRAINTSNISLSDTYSVSMWVNPSEVAQYYGGLMTYYSDVGLFFITGYAWGSACDYQATFYNVGDNGQSPVMSANSWHHLVLSVSGGTGTWYVDGVSGGSQSSGLPSWSPSYIGNDTINEGFYGSLDDVRIYDKALTENEVLLIYNSDNGTEAE